MHSCMPRCSLTVAQGVCAPQRLHAPVLRVRCMICVFCAGSHGCAGAVCRKRASDLLSGPFWILAVLIPLLLPQSNFRRFFLFLCVFWR